MFVTLLFEFTLLYF